jgi:predicted nucleic acid-binding protein
VSEQRLPRLERYPLRLCPWRTTQQQIAEDVVGRALENDASISFQVVQEVLNRLTRQDALEPGQETELILKDVLLPMWTVMPSENLYRRALDLKTRYRYSFYDSLIVAAALEAGCTRLFSEDLQHGQQIEGLTIENPFL